MTDKQITVLNKLVDIAASVDGIMFAGLYPDDMQNIGQRFPAVIVKDGNEDAPNYSTGQAVHYSYMPEILLITEVNTFNTRIRDILALQNKLVTALIADLTISGTVHNVNGHAIEKGVDQDLLSEFSAGFQGELSVHKITLNTTIKDSRS